MNDLSLLHSCRWLSRENMVLWDKKPRGQELVVTVMGDGRITSRCKCWWLPSVLLSIAVVTSALWGWLILHHP